MIRRRAFRQDSNPAEWIVTFEHTEHAIGNAWSANSVKTVTARDEIAIDLLWSPVMREADFRLRARQFMNADVVDLEQQ